MVGIRTLIGLFQRSFSERLLIPTAMCAAFSCNINADSNIFLPSDIKFSKKDSSASRAEVRALCNKQLAQRSEQIRSNQMSATHRALNYDWLASHSGEHRQYHGGRAFGRFAQRMLRDYWERKHHELGDDLPLDENGKIKQNTFHGIDYGLTTSGGGLNIGVNYSFE